MEENKGQKLLIDKYGCNLGSYKFVLPGAELLRYVGQSLMYVHYEKGEGGNWTNSFKPAEIISINNFDPMLMTYDCKYKFEGDTEEHEIKIIPEGYSWGNPEDAKEMTRFVPFSIHTAMVEEQCFFERLKKLYNERTTLTKDELMTISRSKDRDALLKYMHNIGAAVKLENGEYLWIRIHKCNLIHKIGTTYNLKFEDNDKSWSMLINIEDSEYDFNGLGTFKIIDLADYDTKKNVSESTEENVQTSTGDTGIENLIGFSQPVEENA